MITKEIGDNGKRIMTAQEVSEHLRIPLSSLYGLTKRGKIPAIKLGKHWRYLESDIVNLWQTRDPNGVNGGER